MADIGNSNRIARAYLDSLMIETRYMDSETPVVDYKLYGMKAASPIMTAALSHLDRFMFPGAADALAQGAREAGAILWYGMAEEAEIERLAGYGAPMIEIIKPYADRDLILQKIRHAENLGLRAVGIDIDHAFSDNGSRDEVFGYEMAPLRTSELEEIISSCSLPVIIKGILSFHDAGRCLEAGAQGLLLSHHNNRIEYAVPPLAMLPEIADLVGGRVPIFVDCEIQTGMDAFKALALGASGVCIGRPLMTAIKQNGKDGVRDYLTKATAELRKAMAFTGCASLRDMDPTVIHRL